MEQPAATPEETERPSEPDPAIRAFVERAGIVGNPAAARFTPLTGGVSSDIWLVDDGAIAFCVKQALPRLRVAADWRVPVERNAYEAAWLKAAARLVPGAAPRVIAEDTAAGMFAMEYLEPARHHLWKAELLAGRVDVSVAQSVGERLGALHAAFAREPHAAQTFATDANFHAIRLAPYLLATADTHPDLRPQLSHLAETTAATKRTVVHGDVSPKNILIGPAGPVFLDAECAWFGDPAFDLAFCLNHLMLKCLAAPAAAPELLESFRQLRSAYLAKVDWEDANALDARAAALLPALFLARVDGKSPVEYVTRLKDKERVRRVASKLLVSPPASTGAVASEWAGEIGAPA
jgi:aminoglycoside phosphotransferase (APT) family kinase protein